jgi:hypothetical protein
LDLQQPLQQSPLISLLQPDWQLVASGNDDNDIKLAASTAT